MARPYEADDELSTLVLGNLRSPGVVTLSGHDRTDNWDIQPAKGYTSAATVLNGPPPAQFQASFYLADDQATATGLEEPSDFDLWDTFQRLIESMTSGPKPFALPIYHPDLARQGITEVTKGMVGGLVHDGKGGATVVVKFLEFKPKKKKRAANPGAKAAGAVGPSAPPDPNAAAKAELAVLLAEARKP